MLTRFRQRLGVLKDRLERHVERKAGGRPKRAQAPITEEERQFMLGWILGEASDADVIERARKGSGLALIERGCASRPANALLCAVRAQYLLDEGDLQEAHYHAERAFALGRFEPMTGLVLVRVLAAEGRGEDALKILPAALENAQRLRDHEVRFGLCEAWRKLEPDSIEPLLEKARAQVGAGNLDTAIAEFEALLARFGERADILLPLAATYQDQLRLADAQRTYGRAVAAEPGNVDALCMAGLSAGDLGDAASADRLLGRAHEIDPGSPFVRYHLGLLRLEQGRTNEAAALLLGARDARRGAPWTAAGTEARLGAPAERDIADPEWANARFKLEHDIEQLAYLRSKGVVPEAIDRVIAEHRAATFDGVLPAEIYTMAALQPASYPLLSRSYKAPVHAPDPEPPQGALVNPALAWDGIEAKYLAAEPHLAVIDDFLSPAAFEALRAYCLESTIWNELKGGFLGATVADGFSGRIPLAIAAALRERLPGLLGKRPLRALWAYSYDSRYTGIGPHADPGAVSVNFWLTPDAANLDPGGGGLLVYPTRAPAQSGVERFAPMDERMNAHLRSQEAKPIRVAYRANRAVLFDSSLVHESDRFKFAPGYENRRINVTFVYGRPEAH